jgi:hypothetical protein
VYRTPRCKNAPGRARRSWQTACLCAPRPSAADRVRKSRLGSRLHWCPHTPYLPCHSSTAPMRYTRSTLPALLATPTSSTRQPYQLYSPYSANPALLALLYPTSSTRSTLLTHALYPLDPAIEYAVCGSVSMQGHGCSFPRTPVALPSALPASRSSALSLPSPFPRCLPGRRTRRGELVISCIGLLHLLSGSSSVWRVEPRVCRPCSAARAQG